MKIKKINKFFTLIVLSIIVFAGTTFEAQAFNWKDYISAWSTNFVNKLTEYKNKFLTVVLGRDTEHVAAHKAMIMGSSNYAEMLDRMQNFKNDINRREVWGFMQQFVQNYVNADERVKNVVKKEHMLFNIRLKALRDSGVSWYEITCLNDEQYRQGPYALVETWGFLEQLQQFDSAWLNDQSLDAAIRMIESKIK